SPSLSLSLHYPLSLSLSPFLQLSYLSHYIIHSLFLISISSILLSLLPFSLSLSLSFIPLSLSLSILSQYAFLKLFSLSFFLSTSSPPSLSSPPLSLLSLLCYPS